MTDHAREAAERTAYLDRLEAFARAGGALEPAIVLWLIEQCRGGTWGRWCAMAMQGERQHRNALRILVKALVEGTGVAWTRAHWRPIVALLSPRATDSDLIGPMPDLSRLDVGVTLDTPDPAIASPGRIVVRGASLTLPNTGEPAVRRYTEPAGGWMDVEVQLAPSASPGPRLVEAGELHE